ncbi:MAG: hypothetical protein L6R45_13520 [Anaerolineae bacterium]|nr:hypothetical protein [Anaerolineae bacterium]
MFDALVKVGGSLYHQAELPTICAAWAKLAQAHRLLLLPGGGPFADQVRAADTRFQLSSSAAHWMAILAMDQYAYLLADLIPQAVLVRDLTEAGAACAAGQLAVLAPATLLLQSDPLSHSWHITSDSIAAWLAQQADIRLLALLKSVAGVYESDRLLRQVSRQMLANHELVDSYFVQILSPATQCWLIDGGHPERLAELLGSGSTLGTQVMA